MPTVKAKLATSAIYSAPAAGATVAAYTAYRLGVPIDIVLAAAALMGQGFHALASLVQRRRKAGPAK